MHVLHDLKVAQPVSQYVAASALCVANTNRDPKKGADAMKMLVR